MFRVGLMVVGVCCGCASEWSVVNERLDRVVLSVTGQGEDVLLVGGGLGNGATAVAMRRHAGTWQTLDGAGTETLWWVGHGGDAVFMVGENGAAFRVGTSALERLSTPTTATLFGVWGAAADDVWAVGGSPQGNGPNDVLLHFDGQQWTQVTSPFAQNLAYFKVWGSARDDVFVVGQGGVILHFDGTAWSRQTSLVTATLLTVTGRSRDDVWAVGGPPAALLHYDGANWTREDMPFKASGLTGVSVGPAGEVFVVGLAGVKWIRKAGQNGFTDTSDADPVGDLHAVWVGPHSDAWAVGGNYLALGTDTVRRGIVAYYGVGTPTSP